MSEVYFGLYHATQGVMQLVGEEQVLPPEEAQQLLADKSANGVGTGWQAYEALNAQATVKPLADVLYPNALYMLPMAKQLIEQGQAQQAEDIQPVYLRDKVTWKKLPGRE
jgi:tRNA threonylcarbamoyladenosine biosynthesis protein TsaB